MKTGKTKTDDGVVCPVCRTWWSRAIRGVDRYAIDTVLRAGTYEKATTSISSADTWRYTAKQVVKDLTAWVDANRASLRQ